MQQLADFYQGETKRWFVEFDTDISGSLLFFRLAKKRSQTAPDLEIAGVLDPADAQGQIKRVTFEITASASEDLDTVTYHAEHELRSVDRVDIFLPQKLNIKQRVPKEV